MNLAGVRSIGVLCPNVAALRAIHRANVAPQSHFACTEVSGLRGICETAIVLLY